MSKRIHELAKELGQTPKDLIATAERLGIRGKRSQSSVSEDEVARLRESIEFAQRPQPQIGSERVVSERVVTRQGSDQIVTALEQTTETRLRANVIRRRSTREVLKREEVAAAPAAAMGEAEAAPELPSFDFEEEIPPSLGEVPLGLEGVPPLPSPAEAPLPAPEVVEAAPVAAREAARHDGEGTAAVPAAMPGLPESAPPCAEPVAPTPVDTEPARPAPRPAPPIVRQAPPPIGARPETVPPPPAAPAVEAKAEGKRLEEPQRVTVLGKIDLRKAATQAPPPTQGWRPTPEPPAQPIGFGAGDGARKKKGRKVISKPDQAGIAEREAMRGGKRPLKRKALPGKEQRKTEITVPRASKRVVRISEMITVGDLAKAMGVKAGEVLKKLIDMGMMATINQMLDQDTAVLLAGEFEYQVENVAFDVEQALEAEEQSGPGETVSRAPVVTMMGHVDHGKTSLLDAIRSTEVAAGEAGGITQHIGASTVDVHGRRVTFLDTPGHEAFTAMRARGAKVTDMVVLVVAADDGIMPQTVEAINHARAAEVPILVAVNKIDKPEANPERVKQELGNHGLAPEEWGGDTIVVPVSAKTHEGIPQLLEMLLLQADVLELRANPGRLAKGTIVEARLDRGRGPVATVLVQEGTLKVGDTFVCGTEHGRIRAMMDDKAKRIEVAGPSTPVEILGLGGVPEAGDVFVCVTDDAKARQVAEHRRAKQREAEMAKTAKVSLDELYQQVQSGEVRELKVVVKTDVQGSLEAVSDAVGRLSTDEVRVTVIHGAVGGITESDVLLASASNAIVVGFNVRPEPKAAALAEREGIDIRLYGIIYDVVNDVRDALEGLLEPTYQEKVVGRAEVRQTFTVSGVGTIAGCFVVDGKITRGGRGRLLRDHVVVHDGKLGSLKRFKEDAREVVSGYECGIGFDNYSDVKVGDVIEAYEVEEVARRLPPATGRGAHAAERQA